MATGVLPPWESGEQPGIVLVDADQSVQRLTAAEAPAITEADVLLFRTALEDDAILAAWLAT